MKRLAFLLGAIALGSTAGGQARAQADVFRMAAECPRIFTSDCAHISYRLAALVRRRGHRCEKVDMVSKYLFGRGFTLRCNGFAYRYEIEDVGGRWQVRAY